MTLSREDVERRILGELTPAERTGGVAYLAEEPLSAGAALKVPRGEIVAPWPALVAFIDREPTANWGHAARYLLVHAQTGEVRSIDAAFPPFRREQDAPRWVVAYRAPSVPDSALAQGP